MTERHRIAIVGGPRVGKTTAARALAVRHGLPVRHADDLIPLGWSEASTRLAGDIGAAQGGIFEGVSVVRALRKLLDASDARPVEAVVILREPHETLSAGQAAMQAGHDRVLDEIRPELERRGVAIIEAGARIDAAVEHVLGSHMAIRYDSATLGKTTRTPQGFLRAPAALTRTGVLTYRRADGTVVRELRHPDEVFAARSLATLSAAPVTDLHPREMVSPANVRKLSIGRVSDDVRRDGELVSALVTIEDGGAISAVEKGDRRELSCGYHCDLETKPGTYNGERYDAVQRNIVYNHVGLGPKGWGRAGSSVALRLDAAEADAESGAVFVLDEAGAALSDAELEAPELDADRLDADDLELEAVIAERDALRAQVAALEHALGEGGGALERTDAAEAERDALREQLEQLRTKFEGGGNTAAEFTAAVRARAGLEMRAREVLPNSMQLDALSERQIREAVIQRLNKRADMRGKSDEYVASHFDAVLEEHANRSSRRRSSLDGLRLDSEAARRDALDRLSESTDVRGILEGRLAHLVPQLPIEPAPWTLPLAANREGR